MLNIRRHFAWVITALLLLSSSVLADEKTTDAVTEESPLIVETNHGLTFIGIILAHKALRNSKAYHNWPFLAFAMPAAWNSSVNIQKDINKLLTFKGSTGGAFSFAGLNVNVEANFELIHLLELGIQGNLGSAINYGDAATFMGVFDPEKRDYSQDVFLTEYTYGYKYKASLTIPLMIFLPKSDWTKIILKPNASLSYNAYTGAEDGQVWRAGAENSVNGFKYSYGGVLIYILPFERVPMAMVSANVSGFKHAYDFDDAYDDYDPGFVSVSITPMLSIKIAEKWSSMLMASFTRDRLYENYRYEPTEEILQKRIGAEWNAKSIIWTFTRKF